MTLPTDRAIQAFLDHAQNARGMSAHTLRAYGADLVLTDPLEGADGAIREARRLYDADPEQYFYPDQYTNANNWRAHYETTAEEIWRQTDGQVTHFVAGTGTSGTLMGVSRRLRELKPSVRCIAVQPDSPLHGLEGMKHMASALVPGIFDPKVADETIEVSTEDAHRMLLRLAREEGLLVGPSAGANLHAAMVVAGRLTGGVVVTILCDSAAKYLSEDFWRESADPASEVWP